MKVARLVCLVFAPPREGADECDHVDRITTHDDSSNLRWATCAENLANRVHRGENVRRLINDKWQGRLTLSDGRRVSAGCYHSREEAVVATRQLSVESYGEFAPLVYAQ